MNCSTNHHEYIRSRGRAPFQQRSPSSGEVQVSMGPSQLRAAQPGNFLRKLPTLDWRNGGRPGFLGKIPRKTWAKLFRNGRPKFDLWFGDFFSCYFGGGGLFLENHHTEKEIKGPGSIGPPRSALWQRDAWNRRNAASRRSGRPMGIPITPHRVVLKQLDGFINLYILKSVKLIYDRTFYWICW